MSSQKFQIPSKLTFNFRFYFGQYGQDTDTDSLFSQLAGYPKL